MMVDLFPPCRAGHVMRRLCNLSLNGRHARWDAMVMELSDGAGLLMAQAALEMAVPPGQEDELDKVETRTAALKRAERIMIAFSAAGDTCMQ